MKHAYYEITFCESGITEYATTYTAELFFGKVEFLELLQGHHPDIVVAEIHHHTYMRELTRANTLGRGQRI